MEELPFISVIVPIFNMEKYISQCIDSILKQSFCQFELILVDDGSTDNSLKICEGYASRDSRIKVIQKVNSGVSSSRNVGINYSLGKYIVFVDSDDTLPENALEKYYFYILEFDYDIIFANHIHDYNGKLIFRKQRLEMGEYSFDSLKNKIIDDGTLTGFLFGSVCGAIYKKDIILKNAIFFDSSVKVNEDGLFNFKLISHCDKIYVIDEYLYIYRQWKDSSEKSKVLVADERFIDSEIALYDYLENDKMDYFTQLQRRKISILFWNAIRIQRTKCNWKESKKYLKSILSSEDLAKEFNALNYQEMNFYKKILCKLLKRNNLLLFYILTKYFVPIFKKYIKR